MASTSVNSPSLKIILGSSSMARREILSNMGYEFTVVVKFPDSSLVVLVSLSVLADQGGLLAWLLCCQIADIDEKAIRRDKPEELVKALAEAKADAVKLKLHDSSARDSRDQHTVLITSDQVMVSKGIVRERPRSTEEAREFINAYSGDRAFAVNYVLVTNLSTGGRKGGWDIPEIHFHRIPNAFIDEVVKERDMTCVAEGKESHPENQADSSISVAIHQGTGWYNRQRSRASAGAHREAYSRVAGSNVVLLVVRSAPNLSNIYVNFSC